MKRVLPAVLVVLAGCATTASTVTPAPEASPAAKAPVEPTCPKTMPGGANDGPLQWADAKIEKVCLVNESEDGYLKLHEVVAPGEGQPLTTELVARDLQQLVLTGTVKDARALVQPLASGGVVLSYFVSEYPLVGKISFEGVKTIDVDVLRDLALRVAYTSPYALRKVTETMSELYLERGHAHIRITPRVTKSDTNKGDVSFLVEEGPRTTLGSIRFVGNKRLPEAELRKSLRSAINEPYLESEATVDTLQLSALYFDRGMVMVNVDSAVALGKAPDTLELTFTIKEGDVYSMGKLSLKGHSLGDEKAILKTLEVKPGSVFSRAALRRDMDRLKERGVKQGVRLEVLPVTTVDAEKKRIDVVLEVEKQAGGPIRF